MSSPSTMAMIVLAIVLFILGGLVGVAINRKIRTQRLKKRFGPEYDRALLERGDPKEVERELTARLEHVKSLELRSLSRDEADRFGHEWRLAQAQFVDEPYPALQRADGLIRQVMETRGYDVEDFEQRVADISVDYPELAGDFRGLHDIAQWQDGQKLDTEELRQALLQGRELFEKLTDQKIESNLRQKEQFNGRSTRRAVQKG